MPQNTFLLDNGTLLPGQQIRSKIDSFQNAFFLISQPNPMMLHSLESCRRDDFNEGHIIEFGWEMRKLSWKPFCSQGTIEQPIYNTTTYITVKLVLTLSQLNKIMDHTNTAQGKPRVFSWPQNLRVIMTISISHKEHPPLKCGGHLWNMRVHYYINRGSRKFFKPTFMSFLLNKGFTQ